jgi:exodeoxyribonuclease VII large subunit
LERYLNALEMRVQRAAGSYVFREPENLAGRYQQRVDELSTRLVHALERSEQRARSRLDVMAARLKALDPRRVLERGYSVLLAEDTGQAVTEAAQVAEGARLRGILARGELGLTVERTFTPDTPRTPKAG